MTTHTSTSTTFAHGHALLIGVDQNAVPQLALPVVRKDVTALAAVLTDPQVCAYPREQVEIMTGQEATRDGIFAGLDRLRERLNADTSGDATAVVYFSGHGWREENNDALEHYLIPYDINRERLHRSALPAREFAREIAELKPRRLLVLLDCCHAHGMGAKGARLPGPPLHLQGAAFPIELLRNDESTVLPADGGKSVSALRDGEGRAVLSSSRGHERSYYFPDKHMSIFTHHLIEALTGHASSTGGPPQVLVSDILAYLARRVPQTVFQQCKTEQTPDCHISGNFPVAMLLGGKGLAPNQTAPAVDDVLGRVDESRNQPDTRPQVGDVQGQANVGDHSIQVGSVTAQGSVAIGHNNRISTVVRGTGE